MSQKTQVVNLRYDDFDVLIGRPSLWGNPFKIGRDGTREQVIEKYREWIKTQPILLSQLSSLKGKVLGCFCWPQPCHGDVLVEMVEGFERGGSKMEATEDNPRPDCPDCKAQRGMITGSIRLEDGRLMCTYCCAIIPEEKDSQDNAAT